MSKLLLLSNSTMPGGSFFTWPRPHVTKFLGTTPGQGVFIPFAGVTLSFDDYARRVEGAFSELGVAIKSVHNAADMRKAVLSADFIVVGGGNSFALLARLYEHKLLDVVREKVSGGTPYIGWSAGANLACPTIMTTNDMPVVWPASLNAMALVPFQINPHYHELRFEGQGGETRRERLEEFLTLNPTRKVVGLPEGTAVLRNGHSLALLGDQAATLYVAGQSPRLVVPGQDITDLLL